jgi:membrane protein DedA with SNARE-associated domain
VNVRDRVADSPAQLAARRLQHQRAAVGGYALVTLDFGLLANATVPLAVTLLPAALRYRHDYRMDGVLVLWITAAATLHAVGALGPYEVFGWYDQVAHLVSATVVAGVGYALVWAVDHNHEGVAIPGDLRFVFIVVFVLAFGVVWELAEFASTGAAALLGGEALLAQYGLSDVALDLLFNGVGAVVVGLWGTEYFSGVARLFGRRM